MKWLSRLVVCGLVCLAYQVRAEEATQAPTAPSQAKIDLLLMPIQVQADSPESISMVSVLRRVIAAEIAQVQEVQLTMPESLPDLVEHIRAAGPLDKLQRLALINLKNKTGVDGVIQLELDASAAPSTVHLTLVDLRNGLVFSDQTQQRAVSADLFWQIENQLNRFAKSIRRSIRVTLQITSQPADCRVLINDRFAGRTPLTEELRTGSYTVRVEQDGYKPYQKTYQVTDGDRLDIHAVLYNPIATRFLNAPPGLRVDSRQLDLGYRYVFLNHADPVIEHVHFTTIDGGLRINDWEIGLGVALSGFESHQMFDTFLGRDEGDFSLDYTITQLFAVLKYPVWEKYSFASVKLGLAAGLAYVSVESSARDASKWTGSADAFAEAEVRLARGGNFGLDLLLGLGIAYLGELPTITKSFSPFGEGPEALGNSHMFGPMGRIGLQVKWYNDIF